MAKERDDTVGPDGIFTAAPLAADETADGGGDEAGHRAHAAADADAQRAIAARTLNGLLAHCHDATYELADCAEHAQNASVRALLWRLVEQGRRDALEMRAAVRAFGAEPEEGGTAGGALQRGWLTVRGTFGALSDAELLRDAERVQDKLVAACDASDAQPLPEAACLAIQALRASAQESRWRLRAPGESDGHPQ